MHYAVWPLLIILYSPVFWQLYTSRWEYIDYTHAYFILPVSLFLVWLKRKDIRDAARRTIASKNDPLTLSVLIAGILMFIYGWRHDYLVISTFSLIPVLNLISFLPSFLTHFRYKTNISLCPKREAMRGLAWYTYRSNSIYSCIEPQK